MKKRGLWRRLLMAVGIAALCGCAASGAGERGGEASSLEGTETPAAPEQDAEDRTAQVPDKETPETDGKAEFLYYQKDGAVYRTETAFPEQSELLLEAPVLQAEGQLSSYGSFFCAGDGSYTVFLAGSPEGGTGENGSRSAYMIEEQRGAKPVMIAERVTWAAMDGTTLVYNRAAKDYRESPDAIYCYNPSDGEWVLSLQGGDSYGPDLLSEDTLVFTVEIQAPEEYEENRGVPARQLYTAEVGSKEEAVVELLSDDAYYFEGADGTRFYFGEFLKEEGEAAKKADASGEEDRAWRFCVYEKGAGKRTLAEFESWFDSVLGLNPKDGSFYAYRQNSPSAAKLMLTGIPDSSDTQSLFYCDGSGEEILLCENAGEAVLAEDGLLLYSDYGRTDGLKEVYSLVIRGKQFPLTGLDFGWLHYDCCYEEEAKAVFAGCTFIPGMESDDAERNRTALGKVTERLFGAGEDADGAVSDDTAFSEDVSLWQNGLLRISTAEGEEGSVTLIDSDAEDLSIQLVSGEDIYYLKAMEGLPQEQYGANKALYRNGEKIADHYARNTLLELPFGNGASGEAALYYMTLYPERSYRFLTDYAYEDNAVLWELRENKSVKLCEEVQAADFSREMPVLLCGYENPSMTAVLRVLSDGTAVTAEERIETLFFKDYEKAVSAAAFYVMKDEAYEPDFEEYEPALSEFGEAFPESAGDGAFSEELFEAGTIAETEPETLLS